MIAELMVSVVGEGGALGWVHPHPPIANKREKNRKESRSILRLMEGVEEEHGVRMTLRSEAAVTSSDF